MFATGNKIARQIMSNASSSTLSEQRVEHALINEGNIQNKLNISLQGLNSPGIYNLSNADQILYNCSITERCQD